MTASEKAPALAFERVVAGYADGFQVEVDGLALQPGEMVALLGPNGSGKTTLIRAASGVLPPRAGACLVHGNPVTRLGRRSVARQVAVVPQSAGVPFGYTVASVVALGRTPYARWLRDESADDRAAVERALSLTQLDRLAGRRYDELSGGEQQRVLLALALAQEPRLLLLDEPTAHLDIAFQVELLELVRDLNRENGLTVLASMHDLNLAALYFDRLILLKEGRVVADGTPSAVLEAPLLRSVYGADTVVQPHPLSGEPQVLVEPRRRR